MQEAYLKTQHQITHHECNLRGELKLYGLLNYLQDIAAQHADILDFGMETIAQKNMIWILSRLLIKIERMPTLGEKISLETYPTQGVKAFAVRQYAILDEENQPIVKASSFWLLLNASTLRPLKPSEHVPYPPANLARAVYFTQPDKLKNAPMDFNQRTPITVGYADIDLNRHLNNAVYARYIEDEVGKIIQQSPAFDTVQIHFNHAAVADDIIATGAVRTDEQSFYIDGVAPEGTPAFFQAICTLKS